MAFWAVRLSGLLVLLGFIALCSFIHVPRIEADLREKAVSALEAKGIEGVEVAASGRDILLRDSDESGDENRLEEASGVIAVIPGVRQVTIASVDTAAPSAPAPRKNDFSFSVSKSGAGEEILLSGDYPAGIDKSGIVDMLAAEGTQVNVEGLKKTDVQIKGAPEIFTVVAAASKELGKGQISIEPDTIRVSGETVHPNGVEVIRAKLGPFLGLGYALVLDMPDSENTVADNVAANSVSGNEGTKSATEVSSTARESGAGSTPADLAQQCQQQVNNLLVSHQIRFANGRATLRHSSISVLDELAAALSGCPDVDITITGYTDSTGSPAGNVRLSQQRADTVKEYLVSKGVNEGKIKTKGKGAADPIASNRTAAGRARNRRIELTLEGVKQ